MRHNRGLRALTAEEELRLIARHRAGDQAALDTLVELAGALIQARARRVQRGDVPLDDLCQEGALCLVESLPSFDAGRGVRLATWFTPILDARLVDEVCRQAGVISLNQQAVRKAAWHDRMRDEAPDADPGDKAWERDEHKRKTEPPAIPHRVVTPGPIHYHCKWSTLDDPVGRESPIDYLAAPDKDFDKEPAATALQTAVRRALALLPAEEREVVTLYFGLDGPALDTYAVAARIGVSQQMTHKRLVRALRRMRTPKMVELLKDFAENRS